MPYSTKPPGASRHRGDRDRDLRRLDKKARILEFMLRGMADGSRPSDAAIGIEIGLSRGSVSQLKRQVFSELAAANRMKTEEVRALILAELDEIKGQARQEWFRQVERARRADGFGSIELGMLGWLCFSALVSEGRAATPGSRVATAAEKLAARDPQPRLLEIWRRAVGDQAKVWGLMAEKVSEEPPVPVDAPDTAPAAKEYLSAHIRPGVLRFRDRKGAA